VNLRARLLQALDPMPTGALVPVEWVRGIVDECGEADSVDLTCEEVGQLLDRAPSTIRTWAGAGKLPGAYRLHGREWRIPRGALRELRAPVEAAGDDDAPVDLRTYRKSIAEGGRR